MGNYYIYLPYEAMGVAGILAGVYLVIIAVVCIALCVTVRREKKHSSSETNDR